METLAELFCEEGKELATPLHSIPEFLIVAVKLGSNQKTLSLLSSRCVLRLRYQANVDVTQL